MRLDDLGERLEICRAMLRELERECYELSLEVQRLRVEAERARREWDSDEGKILRVAVSTVGDILLMLMDKRERPLLHLLISTVLGRSEL